MSLSETFSQPASAPDARARRPRKKRPSPFSLRLTPDDRARLASEAAGAPLGAYIRAKLLGTAPVRTRRTGLAVEDRQALGQALALLGQSRLASNLNQLAHATHIGALSVDPETVADLIDAAEAVRAMRRLLMTALGLQPEGER